ncbi:MAG: MATE family efflux transporter [Pseudomonadales bacterium]|nr:MATE family efflux transporter [Pseudomonadales bacterium]
MTQKLGKANKLLEDPEGLCLYRLTMPMIIGIVAIMAFNLIDAYYIGMLGAKPLAAMAFTVPITAAVFALTLGLSSGTSAVLARIFGRGDRPLARRILTHTILFAILLLGTLSLVGLALIDPIFRAMGADDQLLSLIREYMSVWFLGITVLVIPMVSNGALRASGDTKSPSFIMSVSALINGILDPLLIFGLGPFPEMGMKGAALSSVLAWTFSCIAALTILIRRENLIEFALPTVSKLLDSWAQVFRIAMPAVLNNLMAPIAMLVIISVVAQFGEAAVAATGVGARLEPALMIVVMSMTAGVGVMVGQNHGAGKLHRVRKTAQIGFRFVFVWQLGLAVLLILFSSVLAGVFTDEKAVEEVLKRYFWIQPISFGMLGVSMLSISILNALHQPSIAILISVFRLFGLTIPFVYLGAMLRGVEGVYMGAALANIIIGIFSYFLMRDRLNKLQQP